MNNGTYCLYHDNGTKSLEIKYENSLKQSVVLFHKNGTVERKYNCTGGHLTHGPLIIYYPDGAIQTICMFNNGILDGIYQTFYDNGRLEFEACYINGQLNGECKSYYPNGQIKIKKSYGNDKLINQYQIFYANGCLKTECTYSNGSLDGICRLYYDDCSTQSERIYRDNKLISITNFWADGKIAVSANKEQLDQNSYKIFDQNGLNIKIHDGEIFAYLNKKCVTTKNIPVVCKININMNSKRVTSIIDTDTDNSYISYVSDIIVDSITGVDGKNYSECYVCINNIVETSYRVGSRYNIKDFDGSMDRDPFFGEPINGIPVYFD